FPIGSTEHRKRCSRAQVKNCDLARWSASVNAWRKYPPLARRPILASSEGHVRSRCSETLGERRVCKRVSAEETKGSDISSRPLALDFMQDLRFENATRPPKRKAKNTIYCSISQIYQYHKRPTKDGRRGAHML